MLRLVALLTMLTSSDDDQWGAVRQRSFDSDSSGSSRASSRTRNDVAEKLIVRGRRIGDLGVSKVDNGASMSPELANVVSSKAFRLRIITKNRRTEESGNPFVGQVGFIRGARLVDSPPLQRRAIGGGERPISNLRSSHFEATPITCLHNVANVRNEDSGDMEDYQFSEIVAPTGTSVHIFNFEGAGYEMSPEHAAVIRGGVGEGEGSRSEVKWAWGHDVTKAATLSNVSSLFTTRGSTFEAVVREGYRFRIGQKIGIAVFRDFAITCEDAGMRRNSVPLTELEAIYGLTDQVNIYTGEIKDISPDGRAFEHDINTFRGCSGAIVFLLDQGQIDNGVIPDDYGKAIAVHAGGKYMGAGELRNIAFKLGDA